MVIQNSSKKIQIETFAIDKNIILSCYIYLRKKISKEIRVLFCLNKKKHNNRNFKYKLTCYIIIH